MASCLEEGWGGRGTWPLTYAGAIRGELEASCTLTAITARAVEAVCMPLTQIVTVAALVNVCKSNKAKVRTSLLLEYYLHFTRVVTHSSILLSTSEDPVQIRRPSKTHLCPLNSSGWGSCVIRITFADQEQVIVTEPRGAFTTETANLVDAHAVCTNARDLFTLINVWKWTDSVTYMQFCLT